MSVEIIGFAASLITAITFVPQVYTIYKLKSSQTISLPTFILQLIGTLLWFAYAYQIGSPSLLITSIFISVCSISIILSKFIYPNNSNFVKKK